MAETPSVQGTTKEFVIDVSVKMKDDLKKITDGLKKLDNQIQTLGLSSVANAQSFQKAGVKLDDWSKVVKSTDQIMFEFNKEIAQIAVQAQALPNKINTLKTALNQLSAAGKQNTAEFAAYEARLRELSRSSGFAGTGLQTLRGQVQNVSFQLTDYIVSVQGGTKASVALTQQLPQLLGGFGALGAALGLVSVVAIAAWKAFSDGADELKNSKTSLDNVTTSLNDVTTRFEKLNLDNIITAFNDADAAARKALISSLNYFEQLAQLSVIGIKQELKKLGSADAIDVSVWDKVTSAVKNNGEALSSAGIAVEQLAEKYKLSANDARKVLFIQDQVARNQITAREAQEKLLKSFSGSETNTQFRDLINTYSVLADKEDGLTKMMEARKKLTSEMTKAGDTGDIKTQKQLEEERKKAAREAADALKKQQQALKQLKEEYLNMYEAIRTPEEKRADLLAKIAEFTAAKFDPEIVKRIYDKAIADTADEITKSTVKWKEALVQSGQESDNVAPKIEYLRTTIANLQATGKTDTGYFRVLTEELQKLDPMVQTISKEFDNIAEKLKSSASPIEDFKKATDELTASYNNGNIGLDLYIEKLAKLKDGMDQATKDNNLTKLLNEINNKVGNTLTGAFDSLIDGIGKTKFSISDFATSFLKDIAKMITQLLIVKPLVEALGNALKGFGVDQFGANSNGRIIPSAKGNTFNSLGLPQGVINQPIMFPMKGAGFRAFAKGGTFGTGLAGEAGPEAIVPLRRTRSGDLGVQGSPVNVIINNNASQEVEVTANSYNGPDMQTMLEVQISKKVRTMVSDGSLDSQFRSSFNLRRSAA